MEVVLFGALIALFVSTQEVPQRADARPELVVMLPHEDGSAGVLVVERDGENVVLDRPYAASRISGRNGPKASVLAAQEVQASFGEVLSALPPRPVSFQLYFVSGTDQLTEESQAAFARMLEELRQRPAPDIVVIGHTDRVGSVEDNDRLSLQRAERVRADLAAQGLAAGRIRAAGRGEREPLVPTADGVDEPRNRRVEISVR